MLGTLARDLRGSLVPHFRKLLVTLCELVDPKDPERLEDVFTALGHLFKHLYKFLLPDLPSLFTTYSNLLSHRQQHVRRFASESFAFLLRKLETAKLPEVLMALLAQASTKNGLSEGLSTLLFETVRGVRLHLHSRAREILGALLSLLVPRMENSASKEEDEEEEEEESQGKQQQLQQEKRKGGTTFSREMLKPETCYHIINTTLRLTLEHLKRGGSAQVLWDALGEHVTVLVAPIIAQVQEREQQQSKEANDKAPRKTGRPTAVATQHSFPMMEVSSRHAASLVGVAGLLRTCASFCYGALMPRADLNIVFACVCVSQRALYPCSCLFALDHRRQQGRRCSGCCDRKPVPASRARRLEPSMQRCASTGFRNALL